MSQLEYRDLGLGDLAKIRDLDRSEHVTLGYRLVEGELQAEAVDWHVPRWRFEDEGTHTVARQVRFCQRHMLAGARAVGAIDEGRLIGIGLMTPGIRPDLAQLAYLHVSAAYRRAGVGARLFEDLISFAIASGARQVYVSAVPTESAVGFYRSRGFRLATPLPELYELEPEDIHMVMDLPNNRLPPAAGASGSPDGPEV